MYWLKLAYYVNEDFGQYNIVSYLPSSIYWFIEKMEAGLDLGPDHLHLLSIYNQN